MHIVGSMTAYSVKRSDEDKTKLYIIIKHFGAVYPKAILVCMRNNLWLF